MLSCSKQGLQIFAPLLLRDCQHLRRLCMSAPSRDAQAPEAATQSSDRTAMCAVYADGRVCISILHNAGDDPHGYEKASERWSPVHTVCSPPGHGPKPCSESFQLSPDRYPLEDSYALSAEHFCLCITHGDASQCFAEYFQVLTWLLQSLERG